MIVKKTLGLEACKYVEEALSYDSYLCRLLTECVDSEKHIKTFFTFLPDEIAVENVKNFKQGGIFPTTTATYLSKYLGDKLNNEKDLVVLFDDVMASPSDDYLDEVESGKFFIGQEVYHYVNNVNGSEKKLLELIFATGVSWHFLAVVLRDKNLHLFNDNFIELPTDFICQNLCEIIIGAFDGEGYIHYVKS